MPEKRTQIYLTERQHREATRRAETTDRSLASVVRDALDRYLSEEPGGGVRWQGDPAFALLGALELPERRGDLNDTIDADLYDDVDGT